MSIFQDFGASGSNPSVVNAAVTSKQYFTRNKAALFTAANAIGVASYPSTPSAISSKGGLDVPGGNAFNGQLFSVVAGGEIVFGSGDPSTNGTIGLYYSLISPTDQGNVSSANFQNPNYQTLFELSFTSQPLDGVAYPWFLKVDLQGTSNSGLLQIFKYGALNGVYTVPTSVAAQTGINFNVNPAMQIVSAVSFSNADVRNVGNLNQFQIIY